MASWTEEDKTSDSKSVSAHESTYFLSCPEKCVEKIPCHCLQSVKLKSISSDFCGYGIEKWESKLWSISNVFHASGSGKWTRDCAFKK